MMSVLEMPSLGTGATGRAVFHRCCPKPPAVGAALCACPGPTDWLGGEASPDEVTA